MVEATNEVWTAVRFLPKSVVERALVRALENSEVKLPGYLGLAAWLEGEPLTLPERWSPRPGHQFRAARAGRGQRGTFEPGKLREDAGGPEIDWEWLPSRPRFVLQLYVADPALLFSSYRRHACCWPGWWRRRPSRP